ncbi:MAG TPA: nitroreductase family protein [Actinomycetota bacterium]|nr:nitroreductase family protein [Actinomycetota bacterium]
MDLVEAISTQRAIRRLRPDPVDDAVVLRIIELALKAPTGGNAQGCEFIVVRSAAVKSALGAQNRRAWAVARRLYRLRARGADAGKIIDAVSWQADHWDEIPVLVVACLRGVPWPVPWLYRASRYGSVYPAVQNLLLAARAEGLGATLTTLPLWNRRAVRRILRVPRDVEPVACIPLGWPLGRYGPTTRKPVGSVTHLDAYGNRPWGQS